MRTMNITLRESSFASKSCRGWYQKDAVHTVGLSSLKSPELGQSEHFLAGIKQSCPLFALEERKHRLFYVEWKVGPASASPEDTISLFPDCSHPWKGKPGKNEHTDNNNNNRNASACIVWRNVRDLWRIPFDKWYFLIFPDTNWECLLLFPTSWRVDLSFEWKASC